jgi:hypothetical protein
MSEQFSVLETDPAPPHPIHLMVTDDLQRNRLTVFFRFFLTIPHLIWLMVWGIAVFLAVVAAWFVGVVTGRIPEGLHGFIASYLRYQTHVRAYWFLAADPFPAFSGTSGYPVDVEIAPAQQQSRLKIFFRLILAIPALIVVSVLQYVAEIVAFGAWFYCLFLGNLHSGLRDVIVYWLRYDVQAFAYVTMLTPRYPTFSED